jgi:hypothetical protein
MAPHHRQTTRWRLFTEIFTGDTDDRLRLGVRTVLHREHRRHSRMRHT